MSDISTTTTTESTIPAGMPTGTRRKRGALIPRNQHQHFLTRREAADILRISTRTLDRMRRRE